MQTNISAMVIHLWDINVFSGFTDFDADFVFMFLNFGEKVTISIENQISLSVQIQIQLTLHKVYSVSIIIQVCLFISLSHTHYFLPLATCMVMFYMSVCLRLWFPLSRWFMMGRKKKAEWTRWDSSKRGRPIAFGKEGLCKRKKSVFAWSANWMSVSRFNDIDCNTKCWRHIKGTLQLNAT